MPDFQPGIHRRSPAAAVALHKDDALIFASASPATPDGAIKKRLTVGLSPNNN